jgi:hypothetical protein
VLRQLIESLLLNGRHLPELARLEPRHNCWIRASAYSKDRDGGVAIDAGCILHCRTGEFASAAQVTMPP